MIHLQNISKTYLTGQIAVKAVDDVSLTIKSGEFVAIMGSSGSGKSTLMHILGLLDRPQSGIYRLAGQDVTSLSDEQLAALRNRTIGFVFQQFHLLPRMSALENAELPLIYAGERNLQSKAVMELGVVGLAGRVKHRPNELSGGQQQRVAIARALVNDPFIIMADEPTGNLDTKSKDEIMGILKQLNSQGKTIVMVTHESDMASHASRVIQMCDGKIVSDNTNRLSITTEINNERLDSVKEALVSVNKTYGPAKIMDAVHQAINAMLANKMRSLLSILGILIGVGAVIAMLALGSGAQNSIEKQLASLGSNLLMIRPGHNESRGVALEAGSVTRLSFDDADALKKIGYIKRVSPSVSGRVQAVYGSQNTNTQVEGVDVDYAPMRASIPVVGRFFTEEEVRTRAKVAVIGVTVLNELFGETNPIGSTIKINLMNFKVIGVLPPKGAGGWRDQDDIALVPITTAMYRLLGKQYVDSIYVEADSPNVLGIAEEEIPTILMKRHRMTKKNKDDEPFQVRNMADIKATLEATTKTMSLLLGSIAAISLLVGGIGIMNIMLVSVTERTREIGLRKAIGATRRDILMQFLVESILMSCIGGALGILIGAGVSLLLKLVAGWTVNVSFSSIFLATAFSFTVGVVFGMWPANKASMLNPIDALRYE